MREGYGGRTAGGGAVRRDEAQNFAPHLKYGTPEGPDPRGPPNGGARGARPKKYYY